MRTSASVVRVPHACHRVFGVQCLGLCKSLVVWVGPAPEDISEEEAVALQAAGRDVPAATGRFSGDCAVAMGGTSIEVRICSFCKGV